jgi:hypothetical protein
VPQPRAPPFPQAPLYTPAAMASIASVTTALETRASRARAALAGSPALRAALVPFLAAKVVSFFIPLLVVWSTSETHGHPSYQEITQTYGYWDGQNYLSLAQQGYPKGPLDLVPGHPGHLWGFFPGLPILIRLLMPVFGGDAVTSGIVVAAAGEFFALYYLAKLVLMLRGGDQGAARFACWLLAFFPDAVFLSVVYTDSVFLAAAIASMYYMLRGDTGKASIAAAVAVAMRVTGLVLIPVLFIEYLWRRRGRLNAGMVDILLALTPFLLFCWYARQQTGDFFAYKDVQQSASYGSRAIVLPWQGLQRTWEVAQGGGPASYNFLFLSDVVMGVLGFAAVVYFAVNWRRIPPLLTLFSVGVMLLITSFTFWQGLMRYEIALVPLYLLGADLWRRRPQLATLVLATSAAWMVEQTYTFATGRFIV